MPRHILLVEGHPDPSPERYNRALADAYADGARSAGHEVERLVLAGMDIPYLRSMKAWQQPPEHPGIVEAQAQMRRADHLVFFYPLWLGDMPALLKSFLEQVSAGGFVMIIRPDGSWERRLTGKSARIVVTMGMPSVVYRLFYFEHSLRSFERNVLRFAGVSPIRTSLIGSVDGPASADHRSSWLRTMKTLGRKAE